MAIEHGKLGLAVGSVAPVPNVLWDAARRKLDEAAAGIRAMDCAKDQNAYEDGWTTLVDSLEEFWHRFYEEGKRTFQRSFEQWVREMDDLRKTDELLKYMTNARHQNQHGRLPLNWGGVRLRIGPPGFSGSISNVKIWHNGNFEAYVNRRPGSPMVPAIALEADDPAVPVVINRGIQYRPPEEHLGEAVGSNHPLAIGNRAWDWHNRVLCDAQAKFGASAS